MGWSSDLQDASFRGVQFECTSVSDAYSKSLAIHQAPYSDDADIEDMGTDPRKISIQAIYSGNDYFTWLKALGAALAETGSGELIHPIYGILEVQVQSWQVQHDAENVDSCTISIEFVKAKAEIRELFIPTVIPAFIDYIDILRNPAQALEKELKALERDNPNAFMNTIAKIRNGLQAAYKFLDGTKKKIDKFLSPRDWMYGLVNDVARLVNFDVRDISAISKWRRLAKRVKNLGSIFDKNDLNHSPALRQAWRATVITSQVAIVQEIVKRTRDEMAKANLSSYLSEASLTPPELATIRQVVRQDIQQAIRDERNISTLDIEQYQLQPVAQIAVYKTVADQVHQQIQDLIETRPPITTTIVNQPSTVHLLAHSLYGDFERSSEILRLNPSLENPAILRTGQELTIYAR